MSTSADVWQPIDSVIESLSQGWSPKCERFPSQSLETWGVIKTSAVMPMQYLEGENKKLPDTLAPQKHLEIKTNDLLITRAGPRNRAAVTCLVRSTRPKLIVCDKVYRVALNQALALPAYIEVVLNAPQILRELNEMKTGISDSGVNLTQDRFRELKIPIPTIQEQQAILDSIDATISKVNASERLIQTSLARAPRLRHSILKRAFEGKLVPQDVCNPIVNTSVVPTNRQATKTEREG